MSTAITVQATGAAISITDGRRSVQQLVAQREAIVEAMQKVMRKDIDFGTVPGTDKPSLWKPGSEKILSIFNLAATPTVEDLSTPDTIRYRVHVSIHHIPTGNVLGVGVGEASSAETKYQWRKMVCKEEWEATPADRRRITWKGGNGKPYSVWQVRTNIEDVANTVLKMAKKRGQIDGVLTATAASDVFMQDVEELVDAGIEFNPDAELAPEPPPQRPEDLQRRTDTGTAQQQPRQSATANQPATNVGPPISAQQARLWWAKSMETHGQNHKVLMNFLRDRIGVTNKDYIPASRWNEALAWAEGKAN